ncbi:MAG: isocitrate lyase/phosphoenolpyruvate mutase family protein, partial [Marivirga sp.]|nr:isocitrate lyase/phosphoenolpyruvate mutase family protein [Marivirga sp.]
FPCITDQSDITAVVNTTSLPVNVMCMPALPDFETLKKLGVKRISIGNFLNKFAYQRLENQALTILKEGNFESLFVK